MVGVSELTEIAILVSNIHDIKIKGIYEENSKIRNLCKVDVISNLKKIEKKDTFFILTTSKITKYIKQINIHGSDVFVQNFFYTSRKMNDCWLVAEIQNLIRKNLLILILLNRDLKFFFRKFTK